MNDQQQALCAELAFREKRRTMAKDAETKHDPSNGQFTSGGGGGGSAAKKAKPAKSLLSKKEEKQLYDARVSLMNLRDSGDKSENNRKLIASTEDEVNRLKAKRDNKIWL